MTDTLNRMNAILRDKGFDIPKDEGHLQSIGVDSLDKLEIVSDAEDEFKIEIPWIEAEKIETYMGLVTLIDSIIYKKSNVENGKK